MQLPHLCALVAALLVQSAMGQTLLGSVVEMLRELNEKSVTDYEHEKEAAAENTRWCTQKLEDAKMEVNATETDMRRYDAEVEEASAQITKLSVNLQQLTANIASLEEDEERENFEKEHRIEQCTAAQKTYTDAIGALDAAISKISELGFVQSDATQQTNTAVRAQLAATARQYSSLLGSEGLSKLSDPEFNRTELSDLYYTMSEVKTLIEGESTKHDTECTNSEQKSTGRISDLAAEKIAVQAEHGDDTDELATTDGGRNTSQDSYVTNKALLETYEGALRALQATCDTESFRLAEQLKTRQGEINVLGKALGILEGDDLYKVDQKYNSNSASILQVSRGQSKHAALASLRAFLSNDGDGEQRTNEFLLKQAHKFNSSLLMNLASSIRRSDPLGKVRTLIEDLLVRLRKEAAMEQTQNEYCDEKLPAAKDDHDKKLAQKDEVLAKTDLLAAERDQLQTQVEALATQIEALENETAEAAGKRANETAELSEQVADAEKAKSVLVQALEMLKGIFGRDAALVQKSQAPDWIAPPPSSSVSEYNGIEEDNDVVVLLEMVYQDFDTLEADARAAEAELASDYEQFAAASKQEMAALVKEHHSNTMQHQDTNQSLVTEKENLVHAQTQVSDAELVYTGVQDSCTGAGSTEEELFIRRQEEIDSLNEALRILQNTDAQ